MSLKESLNDEVVEIFKRAWTLTDSETVPRSEDLLLGNSGRLLDAVILYADLEDSTQLVTKYKNEFAAEVFKAFLSGCSQVIRANGGVIVSFDGDRVMAVFVGNKKNSDAARTGLQINWLVSEIIQPAILSQYGATDYVLKHVVGIDAGEVLATRTGIKNSRSGNSNEVCWVSPAANMAAKMCAIRGTTHKTIISRRVYSRLNEQSKLSDGVDMWTEFSSLGSRLFGSSWAWSL